MKKIKIIITTLFIAVIGASVFYACEKDLVEENNVNSNSPKIQKDFEDDFVVGNGYIFYEDLSEPGHFHWADPTITIAPPEYMDVFFGDAWGEGGKEMIPGSKFASRLSCVRPGNSCGTFKESKNQTIFTGIWVHIPGDTIMYSQYYLPEP